MIHPLEQKIVALRRRVRRMAAVYGLSLLAAALLGAMASLGLVDYLLRFQDRGLRIIASVVMLGVFAWTFHRYVRTTLFVRLRDADLARQVQRRFSGLDDRLASAIDFLHQAEDDPTAGSAALRQAVVAQTMAEAQRLDFADALDRRPTLRALKLLGAACLTAGILVVLDPTASQTAVARLINPFGNTVWPQQTHLMLRQRVERVARGQAFQIEVVDSHHARLPPEVRVHYRFDGPDEAAVEETEQMHYADGAMVTRRENILRPFAYRAEGGDDQSMPWIDVEVVEPPTVESVTVHVIPPAYTGWPPSLAEQHIRALVGSTVQISAEASKPLRSATLCVEGGSTITADVAEDGYTFTIGSKDSPFVIEKSGVYWFELTDREGLTGGGNDRWEIHAVADAAPTVSIEQPTSNLYVTPQAVVPLRVAAKDDLAISRVELVFRPGNPQSLPSPAGDRGTEEQGDGEERFSLWTGPEDPPSQLGRDLASAAAGDRRVVDHRWDLGPLHLQPGTQMFFYATAADYRPQTGKSDPRTLMIITAEELLDRIAGREKTILAELERVLKMQRGCRSQVESLRTRLAELRQLGQAEVDYLQAVGQNQREAEQVLTSRGEGVPMHILALLADLENNRIPSDDVQRRLSAMLDEIDRLGRECLPAIGRELSAAVKMAQVALEEQGRGDGSGSRRSEDGAEKRTVAFDKDGMVAALVAAAKHQDAVLASLEEMIGQLTQWDSYRRFPREIGQLLHDQEDVAGRTLDLGRRTLTQDLRDLTPQDAVELKAVAGRQFELARLLDRFLQEMEQAGSELRQTDPFAAKTVADALDEAYRLGVGGQMRAAGQQIQQNQIGQVAAVQKQIARDLQSVLDILAARRQASARLAGQELARLQENVKRIRHLQQSALEETRRLDAIERPDGQLTRSQALAIRELARQQHAVQADTSRLVERFTAGGPFAVAFDAAAGDMDKAGTLLDARHTSQPTQEAQQSALGRLDTIIDALQAEESNETDAGGPSGEGEGLDQANAGSAGPTLAELRLLRLLQQGVNLHTVQLHQALAPSSKPTEEQARQHVLLSQQQGQLADMVSSATVEKGSDNPLVTIGRRMREMQKRIAQSDLGPATQQTQQQIVADLERLIGQVQAAAKSSESTASRPQPATSRTPAGASTPKSSSKGDRKPSEKSSAPGSARPSGEGKPRRPDMDEMRAMMKQLWGELPEHARQKMLQAPVEEFPPKYEEMIEDYYRRLSEDEADR